MSSLIPVGLDPLEWLATVDPKRLIEIYDTAQTIYTRFRKEKDIIILGPGGVGKSTLYQTLTGVDPLFFSYSYRPTRRPVKQTLVFPSNIDNRMVEDTPGQDELKDSEWWIKKQQDIINGKYSGVIFVCAYGYHNYSLPKNVYASNKGWDSFLTKKYLDNMRKKEESDFEKLSEIIKLATRAKMWLLFFVAKQDIWFEDEQVEVFYRRDGIFLEKIEDIIRNLSIQRFQHRIIGGSTVIRNFVDDDGDVEEYHSVEYDSERQVASMKRFILSLYDLIEWGSS